MLDGNIEALRLEAEGTFADAQHQPPVAQRLRLHHFTCEDAHVADRQLADGGDELDVLGMRRHLHRHLQRRRDQQDVEQVMLGDADAAITQRLGMHRLCHHVLVEALAAQGWIQHVARQEVDEIHGAALRL